MRESFTLNELIAENPQLLSKLYPDEYQTYTVQELASFKNGLETGDRSAFRLGADMILSGLNSVLGSGQAISDFVFDPNNELSNRLSSGREWLDSYRSDQLKFEDALLGWNLSKAQSFGDEVSAVANYMFRNPAVAAAQGIGNVVLPGFAIKGTQLGIKGLSRVGVNVPESISLGRIPFTNKKIKADTGLVLGGSGLGYVMAQGDAAGTAYETVMNLPIAKLEASAAYQELIAKGRTSDQAREELAQEAAGTIGYIPGIIGAAGGLVGAERAFALNQQGLLFRPGTSYLKNFLGQLLVEGVTEGIEEGATAYFGQKPATEIDPTFDPTKGVGAAATFGTFLGAGAGGLTSLPETYYANKQAREQERDQAQTDLGNSNTVDEAITNFNRASDVDLQSTLVDAPGITQASQELRGAVDEYLETTPAPTPEEIEKQRAEQEAQEAEQKTIEAQNELADVQTDEIEPEETTRASSKNIPIEEVAVSKLKLSEDVPQFKRGADAKGVVEKLQGEFDTRDMGALQVWERKNGDLEVISGRHRLDLAKRRGVKTISIQRYREADGFNKRQAAALDAELNIKDEKGEVIDYVDYFKYAEISQEEAESRGLLSRRKGQRGYSIATQGGEEIITSLRNNQISDIEAEQISITAPNNEQAQLYGLRALKNNSLPVTVNLIKAVAFDPQLQEQGIQDLFGRVDTSVQAEKNAIAIAKEVTRRQQDAKLRLRVINGVDKNTSIAAEENIYAENPVALKKRKDELVKIIQELDTWHTNPKLIQQIKLELGIIETQEAGESDEAPAAEITDAKITDAEPSTEIQPGILLQDAPANLKAPIPGEIVFLKEGRSVEIVDPSELGNSIKVMREIARIFGKRIAVFRPRGNFNPDGFVLRDKDTKTIYINADAQTNPLAAFGHELFHLIKIDNPAAYDAIEKVVSKNLKEGSLRAEAGKRLAAGALPKGTDIDVAPIILEEIAADLVGNRFVEQSFWKDVFAEIEAANPENQKTIIQKLSAAIRKAINALLGVLAGTKQTFENDQMIVNLVDVKTAIRSAIKDYIGSQRLKASEFDRAEMKAAEQLNIEKTAAQELTEQEQVDIQAELAAEQGQEVVEETQPKPETKEETDSEDQEFKELEAKIDAGNKEFDDTIGAMIDDMLKNRVPPEERNKEEPFGQLLEEFGGQYDFTKDELIKAGAEYAQQIDMADFDGGVVDQVNLIELAQKMFEEGKLTKNGLTTEEQSKEIKAEQETQEVQETQETQEVQETQEGQKSIVVSRGGRTFKVGPQEDTAPQEQPTSGILPTISVEEGIKEFTEPGAVKEYNDFVKSEGEFIREQLQKAVNHAIENIDTQRKRTNFLNKTKREISNALSRKFTAQINKEKTFYDRDPAQTTIGENKKKLAKEKRKKEQIAAIDKIVKDKPKATSKDISYETLTANKEFDDRTELRNTFETGSFSDFMMQYRQRVPDEIKKQSFASMKRYGEQGLETGEMPNPDEEPKDTATLFEKVDFLIDERELKEFADKQKTLRRGESVKFDPYDIRYHDTILPNLIDLWFHRANELPGLWGNLVQETQSGAYELEVPFDKAPFGELNENANSFVWIANRSLLDDALAKMKQAYTEYNNVNDFLYYANFVNAFKDFFAVPLELVKIRYLMVLNKKRGRPDLVVHKKSMVDEFSDEKSKGRDFQKQPITHSTDLENFEYTAIKMLVDSYQPQSNWFSYRGLKKLEDAAQEDAYLKIFYEKFDPILEELRYMAGDAGGKFVVPEEERANTQGFLIPIAGKPIQEYIERFTPAESEDRQKQDPTEQEQDPTLAVEQNEEVTAEEQAKKEFDERYNKTLEKLKADLKTYKRRERSNKFVSYDLEVLDTYLDKGGLYQKEENPFVESSTQYKERMLAELQNKDTTRDEYLKSFLQDSAFLDDNGNPITLYHGSTYNISEFNEELKGAVDPKEMVRANLKDQMLKMEERFSFGSGRSRFETGVFFTNNPIDASLNFIKESQRIKRKMQDLDGLHDSVLLKYIDVLVTADVYKSRDDFFDRHGDVNKKLFAETGFFTDEALFDLASKLITGDAKNVTYPVYAALKKPFNIAVKLDLKKINKDPKQKQKFDFKESVFKNQPLSTISLKVAPPLTDKEYEEGYAGKIRPGVEGDAMRRFKNEMYYNFRKTEVDQFFSSLKSDQTYRNTNGKEVNGKFFFDKFYAKSFTQKKIKSKFRVQEMNKEQLFDRLLEELGFDSIVFNPVEEHRSQQTLKGQSFRGYRYNIPPNYVKKTTPGQIEGDFNTRRKPLFKPDQTYHVKVLPGNFNSIKSKHAKFFDKEDPDIMFSIPDGYKTDGNIDLDSMEFQRFFKNSKVQELAVNNLPEIPDEPVLRKAFDGRVFYRPNRVPPSVLEGQKVYVPKRVYASNVYGDGFEYEPNIYPKLGYSRFDPTKNVFTNFNNNYFLPNGYYFFDNPTFAQLHSTTDAQENGQLTRTLPFYLNIKKPFYMYGMDLDRNMGMAVKQELIKQIEPGMIRMAYIEIVEKLADNDYAYRIQTAGDEIGDSGLDPVKQFNVFAEQLKKDKRFKLPYVLKRVTAKQVLETEFNELFKGDLSLRGVKTAQGGRPDSLVANIREALIDFRQAKFSKLSKMLENDPDRLKRIIQSGGYDGVIIPYSSEHEAITKQPQTKFLDSIQEITSDINQSKVYVAFTEDQYIQAKGVEIERQGNRNFRLMSKLLDATQLLKQKKGTGASYQNQLLKYPNVTMDEIRATQLDRYFKQQGDKQITPEDIEDYLIENQVMLQEKNNIQFSNIEQPKFLTKKLVEQGDKIPYVNYQEMRISLRKNPFFDKPVRNSHFNETNMLFHTRMTDRKAKVKDEQREYRTLYVDELQSDWGQEGRQYSFKPPIAAIPELQKERGIAMRNAFDLLKDYDVNLSVTDFPFERDAKQPYFEATMEEYTDPSKPEFGKYYKAPLFNYLVTMLYERNGRNIGAIAAPTVDKKEVEQYIEDDIDTVSQLNTVKMFDLFNTFLTGNRITKDGKILDSNSEEATALAEKLKTLEFETYRLATINNPIPLAPFVDDTNKWVKLASKVLLTKAVVGNYDYLSFVPGQVVEERSGKKGNVKFYNEIIPKVMNSVVKKIDPSAVGETNPAKQDVNVQFPTFSPIATDTFKGAGRFSIKITDKIRNAVVDDGLPLFSIPRNIAGVDVNSQDDLLNTNPMWSDPHQDEMRLTNKLPEMFQLGNIRYNQQDKFLGLKRVQERIELEAGRIDDQFNAYDRETTYHGRSAERVKLFVRRETLPLLKSMEQLGVTDDELNKFLHAKHARQRNEEIAKINPLFPDGGSGMNSADADTYLRELPADKLEKLERLSDRVQRILKQTRTILVDSGLETQDTIDAWEEKYPTYVPLFRNLDDADYMDQNQGMGTGAGFSVGGNFSKRAIGSGKPIENILVNIMAQRERAIVRSEKNLVGQALFGLAVKYPNSDMWLAIDPRNARNPERAAAELEAFGVEPELALNIFRPPTKATVDKKTGLVKSYMPKLDGVDNAIAVRIDGKNKYILFNPRNERAKKLGVALKNIDGEALGSTSIHMAPVTRWFAAWNTQYNPVFGGVNFTRDVQGAMIQLGTTPLAGKRKKVLSKIGKAILAIYNVERDETKEINRSLGDYNEMEREYFEFRLKGGKTAYRDTFTNIEDRAKALQKQMDAGKRGPLKKAGFAAFEWLSDFNDTLENGVRLAVYQTGKEEGLSTQESAVIAKNVTVNFNKKGRYTAEMGAWYAFFGAAVSGTARMGQVLFSRDPRTGSWSMRPYGKLIIRGGLAIGAAQAFLLHAAGFDEDDVPLFVKEKNLVIPTGVGKKYITIPMPLGYNTIPNTSRHVTEWMLSGGKNTGKHVVQIFEALLDTFNPIGSSHSILQTISPTGLDPVAALHENKDWNGRPIYREDMFSQQTPGWIRSQEGSSSLFTTVAYYINYATSWGDPYKEGFFSPTPDQIDYVFGQVFGGAGREVSKTVNALGALYVGDEIPPYKIPLAGRFFGDAEANASMAGKYYQNLNKIQALAMQEKNMREDGLSTTAFKEKNPLVNLRKKAAKDHRRLLKYKREKINIVRKSAIGVETANPERIKELEEKMKEIMNGLVDRVKAMEEKK